MQDNVWVYELPGPGRMGRIEWGQFQGDSKHQGYYELGKNLPAHAFLSTRVRGSGRITATGINCGTDCIENVSQRRINVTLTAAGTGGHAFAGWLGACAGQANPCTVAMKPLHVGGGALRRRRQQASPERRQGRNRLRHDHFVVRRHPVSG